MDIRKVKKLIELLEESNCTELEIREGEESVRISRAGTVAQYAPAPMMVAAPAPTAAPAAAPAPAPVAEEKPKVKGHEVKSPMVGTVYRASSPEAKAFVEIGSVVKAGDTLCLIEAMKMFNPIEADTAGVIADILISSGDPVEYGQTLFVIQK
ncbi:MAG: acetyl-CoA carboxylase biotin carboxyl carrier protein [Gammaproteobacteria bacterium]